MKLECVVTACNTNSLYCNFIPLFTNAWKKLYPKIDVKIILVNKVIPPELKSYTNNIIIFEPIPDISTAFISQYIRLLYPSLLGYKNGIMITDIDMIPMNSTYFTKNIEYIDDNSFVYLRDKLLKTDKQIAMCYNVGASRTWAEIFNIETIEDIIVRIKEVYNKITYLEGHGNMGWDTDQVDCFKCVMKWHKLTGYFVYLNDGDTGFSRLDRNTFYLDASVKNNIKSGYYSDYHCYRPYHQYEYINNGILKLL